MTHLLRLISGDKRNPIRALDFTGVTDAIHLMRDGFNPAYGEEDILWSGRSIRFPGERRLASNPGNAQLSLTYDIKDDTAGGVAYWQREVHRFFIEAGWYEEDRQGEPVWIEYRWHEGITDILAPVFGQFNYYLRVLHGRPGWPDELHNGQLLSGVIESIVARLTCAPYPEGLPQQAGLLSAAVMEPGGLMVSPPVTNLFTNPSFGHSTYDNDWSAGADLEAYQETRYTRSLNSAVHLVNNAGTDRSYRQTLTLTAATYWISCYARRPDGAAVTASDINMVGQGAGIASSYVSVGDGWYFVYGSFDGLAASSTHGVNVVSGRSIILDDLQVELESADLSFPLPFCAGYLPGCAWSGTAHDSSSSRANSTGPLYTMTDEFSGEFTIAGWIEPWLISTVTATTNPEIFRYLVDNDNLVRVYWDISDTRFALTKSISATLEIDYAATTFSYRDRIHVAVVQSALSCKLYLNGVAAGADIGVAPYLPGDGDLSLGSRQAAGGQFAGLLDGWRVWTEAMSAAQVLSLYTNELPIKTGGGSVGMPLFMWTKDGDNVIDNVNDTSRDNYGIIGGVAGDVEALTEWQIDPPTTTPSDVYWLALKASAEPVGIDVLYLEYSGTADANSSGGEYEQLTSSSAMTFDALKTLDLDWLPGTYQVLVRLYVATQNITIYPRYAWLNTGVTGDAINGDTSTIATNANFLWRDLGDLLIDWPGRDKAAPAPSFMTFDLIATPVTGTPVVRVDFVQLLPRPFCRVEPGAGVTFAAGDTLTIIEREAFVRATAGSVRYLSGLSGDAVNVRPNKYNYVLFLQGEEGQQYDVADTATFAVYVTPRWLLPGGAIA